MEFGRSAYSRLTLLLRFSLLVEKAEDAQIDEALRKDAELRGSTSWILMLAIFIASIGLNTDSTAVIIGAMLVSPLMGPIMGVGYGVGIYDFDLVKKSLGGLAQAVGISLATSAFYFALSPLSGSQSELLARTSPTIWDVQIALFGGLAGIIGATRKERSNVIPGVAIATALMPPLCTAGFGLASLNWRYFLGAFYLFAINGVFIALATAAMVRIMALPPHSYVDKTLQARVKGWLLTVAVLTALPSVYLASRLVDEELFGARARSFVAGAFRQPGTHVVDTRVDAKSRRVVVTLVGDVLPQSTLQDVRARLGESGLSGATLEVFQTRDPAAELALRAGKEEKAALLATRHALEDREQAMGRLKQRLAAVRPPWLEQAPDLVRELQAMRPDLKDIVISAAPSAELPGAAPVAASVSPAPAAKPQGQGPVPAAAPDAKLSAAPSPADAADLPVPATVAVLNAASPQRLKKDELARIESWFKARTKAEAVRVSIEHRPPPPPARKRRR